MLSFHVRVSHGEECGYIEWPDGAPLPQVGDGFVFGSDDRRRCVTDTCFYYELSDNGLSVTAEITLEDDDDR